MKVISKFACYDAVNGRSLTTYRIVEDTDEYSHICYRIQFYMQHYKKWANEYQNFVHWSTLSALYSSREFHILFGQL